MILAAGAEARRRSAGERMGALARRSDWSRLAELLAAGRLLPTLGPRVAELAGPAAPEFEAKVAKAIEAARRQDALLLLIGEQTARGPQRRGHPLEARSRDRSSARTYTASPAGASPATSTSSSPPLSCGRPPRSCVASDTRRLPITLSTTDCRSCTSRSSTNEESCRRWSCTGGCTGTSRALPSSACSPRPARSIRVATGAGRRAGGAPALLRPRRLHRPASGHRPGRLVGPLRRRPSAKRPRGHDRRLPGAGAGALGCGARRRKDCRRADGPASRRKRGARRPRPPRRAPRQPLAAR